MLRRAPTITESVSSRFVVPSTHRVGNKSRVTKLIDGLELERYGVKYARPSLEQCLYVQRHAMVDIGEHGKCAVMSVYEQGQNLLNLHWNLMMLRMFRRSEQDINGYDFNYIEKIAEVNLDKLQDRDKLYKNFIRSHDLNGIARIRVPQNKVRPRVQLAQDLRVFYATIGYLSIGNDRVLMKNYLQRGLIAPITHRIFQ